MVGGGPAGYPAAVQAARLGASTLLVEKNGALGGTTTVAGVALPGLFHAWGKQIIAGIGYDAVSTSVEECGRQLPDFRDWKRPHHTLQIPVEPAIYAALVDDLVTSSGAALALHTMLASLDSRSDHWSVELCTKEGLKAIKAKIVVDCTGDADAVGQAGFHRIASNRRQPGTLVFRLAGYDPDTLDYVRIADSYRGALETDELYPEDLAYLPAEPDYLEKYLRRGGHGINHVIHIDGSTSQGRTHAELSARRALLRVFKFLIRQPGLQGLTVPLWSVECGVRETFTIDGVERITIEDYSRGRSWPDALTYSFYPIDVHRPDGNGVDIRPLRYGIIPTIPRAAMIPKGSSNLIVAGRAISGDQEANSSYRVQASCMAMGQAAGAVSALAAESRTALDEVPLEQIWQALRENGAIVPGDVKIESEETARVTVQPL